MKTKWILFGKNIYNKPLWMERSAVDIPKSIKLVNIKEYTKLIEFYKNKIRSLRIYKVQKTKPKGWGK